MKVFTWFNEEHGALARIQVPGNKAGSVMWLPVFLHAPTEAEAEAKAHAFYADELRRVARQAGLSEKRREAAKKSAEVRRRT